MRFSLCLNSLPEITISMPLLMHDITLGVGSIKVKTAIISHRNHLDQVAFPRESHCFMMILEKAEQPRLYF